jgi:hypothetical protein
MTFVALLESPWYRRTFPTTRIWPYKNTETEIELTARGFGRVPLYAYVARRWLLAVRRFQFDADTPHGRIAGNLRNLTKKPRLPSSMTRSAPVGRRIGLDAVSREAKATVFSATATTAKDSPKNWSDNAADAMLACPQFRSNRFHCAAPGNGILQAEIKGSLLFEELDPQLLRRWSQTVPRAWPSHFRLSIAN